MIIIIEGPDGAGKTSLAEQLVEGNGYELIHMSNPRSQKECDEMFMMYVNVITKRNNNFILDRSWYSDMAYGPIFRGGSSITHKQMLYLEDTVIKAGGGMVIHATDSIDILWNRCQNRGEDFVKAKKILRQVKENYHEIFDAPHLLPILDYKVRHPYDKE